MLDGASGRDRLDGDTEVLADHVCDLAGGDAFLSHTVQHGTRRRPLEGQAEETCRIDTVHRRPAARTVAQEAGDAPLTSDADNDRDEAVVALTVDRRREPNGRGAHAAIGERQEQLLVSPAASHGVIGGVARIRLGGGLSGG